MSRTSPLSSSHSLHKPLHTTVPPSRYLPTSAFCRSFFFVFFGSFCSPFSLFFLAPFCLRTVNWHIQPCRFPFFKESVASQVRRSDYARKSNFTCSLTSHSLSRHSFTHIPKMNTLAQSMADTTIKGLGAPPENFDGSPHRFLIVHARQVSPLSPRSLVLSINELIRDFWSTDGTQT